MQSIDWRNPAAYKRIKDLPPAGFAWEYLRRNEDYRHDVERLAQRREPTGE
ncbi:transcriptional regulator domain-containing protein [Brucellaceae bacterium D45D]